jgi:hypothetical protein
MLPAARAELLEFQPLGCRFLVLGIRVIPFLALGALERDDFPRHVAYPLKPCIQPQIHTDNVFGLIRVNLCASVAGSFPSR